MAAAAAAEAPLRVSGSAAADAMAPARQRFERAAFLSEWSHVSAMSDEAALRNEYARWLMDPSRSVVRCALAALEADTRAAAAVAASAGGRAAFGERIHAIEGAFS